MPRYAKANTTQEELRKAIMAYGEDDDDEFEYALHEAVYSDTVHKDLSKVESEYENVSCIPDEFYTPGFTAGWDTINNFTVLWIALGSDAEQPFAAVLYLDDKSKLRAYIPKDGNCYDKKHKMAYGYSWWEQYGEEQGIPEFGDDGFDEAVGIQFDDDKLRADAAKRIQVKEIRKPFMIKFDAKIGLQVLDGYIINGLPVLGFSDVIDSDGDGPLSDENVRNTARYIFEHPEDFTIPYTSMEFRPSKYGKGWDIVVADF